MLEFILWVILIYFVLLLLWRYVLPFFLRRGVRKMQEKFTRAYDMRQEDGKKEGDITIEEMHDQSPAEPRHIDESEYVDFEEIKNDDPNK